MDGKHPNNPCERYADDGAVHCGSLKQAEYISRDIEDRMKSWNRRLHPDRTHIVYCKDDDSMENYPETSFDFLGNTFRPRRSKNRYGKFFINFSPAVSNASRKAMRQKMHYWRMHLKPDKSLEDITAMFNPAIGRWFNYFSNFYKSETYPCSGS